MSRITVGGEEMIGSRNIKWDYFRGGFKSR